VVLLHQSRVLSTHASHGCTTGAPLKEQKSGYTGHRLWSNAFLTSVFIHFNQPSHPSILTFKTFVLL